MSSIDHKVEDEHGHDCHGSPVPVVNLQTNPVPNLYGGKYSPGIHGMDGPNRFRTLDTYSAHDLDMETPYAPNKPKNFKYFRKKAA